MSRGNVLAEYGLVLGLVLLIAMVALSGLGTSIYQLFMNGSSSIATGKAATIGLFGKTGPSASKMPGRTRPGAVMRVNPRTGIPSMVSGEDAGGTNNVTSVEGSKSHSGKALANAKTLEALANKEKNPEFKAYYARLSQLSFLSGAAEGRLDGLKQFDSVASWYEPDDALSELLNYQKEMQSLLLNPPPGITGSKLYKKATPLAAGVYNIGQTYESAFQSQISADGKVTPFRYSGTQTGKPGSGLSAAQYVVPYNNPEFVGDTKVTDALGNMDAIKSVAQEVVSETGSTADSSAQTFSNALGIEEDI